MGIPAGQEFSHLLQAIHRSYNSASGFKLPLAASDIALDIGRLLGQALSHSLHPRHLLAMLITSLALGMALNLALIGAILSAALTATSPTFSGSSIRAPGIFPLINSSTILSAGSFVLSGNPWQFFLLVAITTAFIFLASSTMSVLMHCSSITMTSGTPVLTNLTCHEMGPMILAWRVYLVSS